MPEQIFRNSCFNCCCWNKPSSRRAAPEGSRLPEIIPLQTFHLTVVVILVSSKHRPGSEGQGYENVQHYMASWRLVRQKTNVFIMQPNSYQPHSLPSANYLPGCKSCQTTSAGSPGSPATFCATSCALQPALCFYRHMAWGADGLHPKTIRRGPDPAFGTSSLTRSAL